jgi:ribosome-binding ATPase YchF (GTP1/OBG family)
MKIGIVGYQGSGKSTLFSWLTGVDADPALAHVTQSHMTEVLDPRMKRLYEIYKPKKETHARLEIVDTPGLSRSHEGSAQKLALIREAGCLIVVVAAYDTTDPAADLRNFADDLLIADLDIVSGRVERLREAVKKPRANREEQVEELEALEPLLKILEGGQPLHTIQLAPEQERAIKSFQLFARKPRFVIFNTSELETDPGRFQSLAGPEVPSAAVSLAMQRDLARMAEAERAEFCAEMGVAVLDRQELIQRIMDSSGQMVFFTAGEKEIRTWLIRRGSTAVEAAGAIHTDLARGFVRAETMTCDDLFRLGSEREIKANNLMRQEPKDYVIRDGDIITIRHNA